tara:strand:- start:1825 stop:2937 length:1113 start_codon:yes stop_codon:yes gene_type:complete
MLKTVHLFYPSFEQGGATKNLIRIVNFLLKKKIKVFFFTCGASKNNFIKTKNLRIINSKPLKKLNFLPMRWNLAISSMINLNFYLKENKKHSIIFSMQSHIPAIIIAKINQIKIVIRNSEEPISATFYADNKVLSFFVLFLKIIFYNFSDKIIAISTKSKHSLQKIVLIKEKVTLIYNPYLEKIFRIKRKIKKTSNNINILSIGRLTKQKNFVLLIDTVIKLSKKYKGINLLIIGNGDLKNYLTKKIKNQKNIKIINWKDKLKKYYSNSDLFVLPSYYEGLPNVLIDAVNNEIPIISTNCSGASDILHKNSGGFIIPINNQHELEKKIIFVMKNYFLAKNKVLSAKKRLYKFSDINLDKYYNLLCDIYSN